MSERDPSARPPEAVRQIHEETVSLMDGPIDLRLGTGEHAQNLRIVNPLRDIGPESASIVNVHIGCFIIDPQTFAPHAGFKALRHSETVILGRQNPGRFDFSEHVSRAHVRIEREHYLTAGDAIRITDLDSTNGTYLVEAHKALPSQPDVETSSHDDTTPRIKTGEHHPKRYRMGGKSAPRNESNVNEDTYFIDEEHKALAVFDGMGGHAGSEEASAIAAEEVQRYLRKIPVNTPRPLAEQAIRETLENAHQLINKRNAQFPPNAPQIGTTAIVAKIFETASGSPYAMVGSAGDSRAYLLRRGRIEHVTLDHAFPGVPPGRRRHVQDTLAQAIDLSQLDDTERQLFLMRATINSCLGAGPDNPSPTISMTTFELQAGDQILLTSDGVHDNLTNSEIEEVVLRAGGNPDTTVDVLVKAAKARSKDRSHDRAKPDDTTAAILSCE